MPLSSIFRLRRPRTGGYEIICSTAVLKKAAWTKNGPKKGRVEKGVLLLNQADILCREIPDLKKFFYLVERNGWSGINASKTADIKLMENLETIGRARKDFPNAILLEFANADFVNTDLFRPLGGARDSRGKNIEKEFTGIQISAWEKFKRHDLFVRAAALLPEKKFIKFGHFWGQRPDKPDTAGIALKKETIALSNGLGADISYPFADIDDNDWLPTDPESMNVMINRAKMGILTTEKEGINRFKMECLSADVPFLVPDDVSWPTKKHINEKTGLQFRPTPEGLAEAIEYVEKNYAQFSPREYILSHTGMHIATEKLKDALRTLARRDGSSEQFDDIFWDGRNPSMLWDKKAAVAEIRSIISQVRRDSAVDR